MVDDLICGILLALCLAGTVLTYVFAMVVLAALAALLCLWRWAKRQLSEFVDWIENGMYLP